MVAFDFSPEHAPKVESGEKCMTIRRTKRGRVGARSQLYTGQRTPACRKLRPDDPPIIAVTYCAIRPDYLTLGDVRHAPRDINEFAKADGFASYKDMVAWFEARYGSPYFIGYLHAWAPLRNVRAANMDRSLRNIVFNVEQAPDRHTVPELLSSIRSIIGLKLGEMP